VATQVVTGTAATTPLGTNAALGALTGTSTAACPAGTILLGGGALAAHATSGNGLAAAFDSRPLNGTSTTTWEARAVVTRAESGTATNAATHISVTAYAICTT
jgi:hypothetical protein